MRRREIIQRLIAGVASTNALLSCGADRGVASKSQQPGNDLSFKSKWHLLPDMVWTGEELWAQRLQDWCIRDGELQCLTTGINRTVHILTHQLTGDSKKFHAKLSFRFLAPNPLGDAKSDFAGLSLGVKGRFNDYRSAIMSGSGINAGVTRDGYLFIDKTFSEVKIPEPVLTDLIRLTIDFVPHAPGRGRIEIKAVNKGGDTVAFVTSEEFEPTVWKGNVAIVSHFKSPDRSGEPTIAIKDLELWGEGFVFHPQQVYGAVYFAQYTVNERVLKLTAQLPPVEKAETETALYLKENGTWTKVANAQIHPVGRIAAFRIEDWNSSRSVPYKVVYELPLRDGTKKEYTYEGLIAAEPLEKESVRALAFSCNWDYGFPDNEVMEHASMHDADIALFLGDQFYESNGRFGVQTDTLEMAVLDYLRKWFQFGWSYRELFRRIPMVALPDDHDMYHGNIWGSGGRAAASIGTDAERQDGGGYKMPPGWVNMAQLTQTSHMPDPWDPSPVQQGIGVYYCKWEYAGISFGIIEDRKFKSAPRNILPPEANVYEGYAQNPDFDPSKVNESKAELLGKRQMTFLRQWSNEDGPDLKFKVLLSATPFCCLQTLPEGTKNDEITPSLPIPEYGEYPGADVPTRDMDSNGWPQNCRDEVIRIIRNRVALHICGDQHLGSVVRYGVDDYEDGPFCFAVPALCNIWPRRWWPQIGTDHDPLPGKPAYTGNFLDGFGNKMTVYAAASPFRTGKEPGLLYDRATGYGVIELNKINNRIVLNCFPRYEHERQYTGWPLLIEGSERR